MIDNWYGSKWLVRFYIMWPRAATQNMCLSLMALKVECGVFGCIQLDH